MREGLSMQAFAAEVQRQANVKRDFRVPTTKMRMVPMQDYNPLKSPEGYPMKCEITLDAGEKGTFGFPARRLFHQQLADRLRVPWDYYERCHNAAPELLCGNVNYWLQHGEPEVRMVRTLDHQARAYLGSKYRPMDNFDLFRAVAPFLMGDKARGIRVMSVMITETRFYIKAFTSLIRGEVTVGDVVEAGVTITNSEVGHGQISVEPSFLRLICLNGATINDSSLKRRHVGGRSDTDGVEEYYSDRTRSAMDDAFWRQVVDVVAGCFDDVMFAKQLDKLKAAADHRIPKGGASLQEIVQEMTKNYSLSNSEGDLILKNLIEGGDLSQYGLMNAITLAAQSEDMGYDRATDLEHIGGQILELPQKAWNDMVSA
jgi:hypothetical protein